MQIPRQWRVIGGWILPFFYLAILSLFLILPLLRDGSVFLLDHFLTPHPAFVLTEFFDSTRFASSLPFALFLHLSSFVIATDILQKWLFFFLFFGMGVNAYVALPKKLGSISRLIASIFYVVNPFVYERFTAGHIGVLFGYSLLPVCFRLIRSLFETQIHMNKKVSLLSVCWTAQIIFATHFVVLTGVCLLVVWLEHLYRSLATDSVRIGERVAKSLSIILRIIILMAVFNFFWLLPLVKYHFVGVIFSLQQFAVLRSAADQQYGLMINLLGLYGFWRERTAPGEILLAKDVLPWWPILLFIILIPVGLGFRALFRSSERRLALVLGFTAVASIFLSVGPQLGIIGQINTFFFKYVPGFSGMRESQKFLALLPLVYAWAMAYGLSYMQTHWRPWIFRISAAVIFAAIVIYTYPMFWGMNGQVRAMAYPPIYEQTRMTLLSSSRTGSVLILPWHMYLASHPLGQGRTLADPAPAYFAPYTVLSSNNPEVTGVVEARPIDKEIEALFRNPETEAVKSFFSTHDIRYIFVTKIPRYRREYDWLWQAPGVSSVFDDDFGALFRVR